MTPAFTACLVAMMLIPRMLGAADGQLELEARRLHLGKPGQWEWDIFKHRKVDAERLEYRFQAKSNATEQTLRIWQRDVKLDWQVKLNGRRLGNLVAAEEALEALFALTKGSLRDGENILTIEAPKDLDDIEVGPITIVDKPGRDFLAGASIEVAVTDANSGKVLPSRLTLTRLDGTLQPLRAEPTASVAVRTGVVYVKDGKATIYTAPGDYVLHAGRGFEWGLERAKISLSAGGAQQVAFKLQREVPTEGWVAADSHIHTFTHSRHGDATIEERMITLAGEGIELAIATDHNHHADFAPVASKMGVSGYFTSVVGNEVTTNRGHFNAFPVERGSPVVKTKEDDWAKLVPLMRSAPGVKVITLNHPRDDHQGFIPFGETQFNPKTGKHRDEAALANIDAVEVVTSGAMQSDIHQLYRDWFALLNRGLRISAIASSDSHDVNRFIVGQGRTYVATRDEDPAHLDLDDIWRSYQQGRLLVSLGLLTHLKVNDKFIVGDLATGLGEVIKVEASVLGPAWAQADHIELYANGRLIREQDIRDDHRAGLKAKITWMIPRPAHDVHLVVIATGPGVSEPFWGIARPYQPTSKALGARVIGSTNPIWLDVDGDGKFHSALAYAQALLKRHGNDRGALSAALKNYDEAVAVQVAELLSAAGLGR